MEASDYPSTSISLRLNANLTTGVIAVDAIRSWNDLYWLTVGDDQSKLGVSEDDVIHLGAIEINLTYASTIIDRMDMFLAEVVGL